MESVNKVAELIKQEILDLENGIAGTKSEIQQIYKKEIADAEKKYKTILAEINVKREKLLEQFKDKEAEIKSLKLSLKALGASTKIKSVMEHSPLKIPAKYNANNTMSIKIAFVLNKIGAGFKENIAAHIATMENKDEAQITKQISGLLSQLKKKGQLASEKDGRRDKYSLVK